jgi:hypothetical protein
METLFIYLLKSSGLVTLFFLAYYFYYEKKPFSPTVGFAGLITSRLPLLVFTKTVCGTRNNRLVANSRWYR